MGDDWMPAQSGDIDVEITDLYQFAWYVAVDKGTLESEWAAGPGLLLDTDANLAGLFRALTDFHVDASTHRMALNMFLTEAGMGLQALTDAATAIADQYAGTDAFSAATLDAVTQAFAAPTNEQLEQILAEDDPRREVLAGEEFDDLTEHERADPSQPLGNGTGDNRPRQDQVLGAGTTGEYVVDADDDDVAVRQPGHHIVASEPSGGRGRGGRDL